jgi:hypothetical protein
MYYLTIVVILLHVSIIFGHIQLGVNFLEGHIAKTTKPTQNYKMLLLNL